MNEILQKIASLDSDTSFWGRVGSLFDKMELAEQEIEAAKECHPESANKLHDCFKLMCPTPPLGDKADSLYRAHCRELLERVHNDVDTRPGTAAEILAIISTWSLERTPGHDITVLAARLFAQVYPDRADIYDHREVKYESWEGATDELYARLQKKATVETRMF